ncbi:UNVERIFIED_CONTAM: hypothetical protein FKN15_032627 [Acipenser sinensis]
MQILQSDSLSYSLRDVCDGGQGTFPLQFKVFPKAVCSVDSSWLVDFKKPRRFFH